MNCPLCCGKLGFLRTSISDAVGSKIVMHCVPCQMWVECTTERPNEGGRDAVKELYARELMSEGMR